MLAGQGYKPQGGPDPNQIDVHHGVAAAVVGKEVCT